MAALADHNGKRARLVTYMVAEGIHCSVLLICCLLFMHVHTLDGEVLGEAGDP